LAELSLSFRQTFETVILVNLFPRSQIDIFVQIIQSDGGEKSAAINAITLALIDAGVPLSDFVTSCSAGLSDSLPILDLNYVELTSGSPELIVALLPKSGQITLTQLDSRLPLHQFEKVFFISILINNLKKSGCSFGFRWMSINS